MDSQRSRRLHGFTLIELLIVLSIGIVLTTIAVPSYSALTRNYRTRNDAHSLASMTNLARMRAASEFSRIQVSCDNTSRSCTLSVWPYGAASASSETSQQTVILSPGVSFGLPSGISLGAGGQSAVAPYQGSRVQSIANSFFFNSRGQPIANDGVGTPVTDYALYLVGPNGTSMAVCVDASGRPLVYNLDGSTWRVVTN